VVLGLLAHPALRSGRERRRLVLTLVSWAVVFALEYAFVLRPASRNPYLRTYWEDSFLDPRRPGFFGNLHDAVGGTLQSLFFGDGASWRATAALIFLVPIVWGGFALFKRAGRPLALACCVAPLIALAASAARVNPFAPRLTLFLAPVLILLCAAGIQAISDLLLPGRAGVLLTISAVGLLALAVRLDVTEFRSPREPQDVRTLSKRVLERVAPGEPVYIFARALPAWTVYSTDWKTPDLERVVRYARLVSSTGPAFRNAPARMRPVGKEGWDLSFVVGSRIELVGTPTGQGPSLTDKGDDRPDSGWAANEAARIRSAADSTAWVLLASFRPAALSELESALESAGGEQIVKETTNQAALLRYRFRTRQFATTPAPGSH